MKIRLVLIFIFATLSLSSQTNFTIGTNFGYSINNGPIEKYKGVQLGGNLGYHIKRYFIKLGYEHLSGTPNYGTTYSKDLDKVAVFDIYDNNYPLTIYPSDDFSEVKVGVHQFDPDFGKYIARQVSIGVGYSIPFNFNNIGFRLSPSLSFVYRRVNENFVYGVKEIFVEDSFQSENWVPINHLIFAYLRYAVIGTNLCIPVEMRVSDKTWINIAPTYSIFQKSYKSFNVGIGLSTQL